MNEPLDSVPSPNPFVASTKEPGPDHLLKPPGANYYGDQDKNGVDLSLLRYTLSLTPLERLQLMEKNARETLLLNEYGRRARQTKPAADR
jgi:hypothetical protein